VGSRAAANNSGSRGDPKRLPPFILAGGDLHKQQNPNKQLILIFLLCRSVLGSVALFWSCCSFLLLQAADMAAEEGVLEAGFAGAAVGSQLEIRLLLWAPLRDEEGRYVGAWRLVS
jgi:hypothetical protein